GIIYCVGGVTSPILSNIYLDRLDKFAETVLIPEYTRGIIRVANSKPARTPRRDSPGHGPPGGRGQADHPRHPDGRLRTAQSREGRPAAWSRTGGPASSERPRPCGTAPAGRRPRSPLSPGSSPISGIIVCGPRPQFRPTT